jgi:hypothetical protein
MQVTDEELLFHVADTPNVIYWWETANVYQ